MNKISGEERIKPLIGPLDEADLEEAGRIMRLAFGTFLNLPDPTAFLADADYTGTRFRACPDLAFGAKMDGRLAGSVFVTHWGSAGFFGPLTVHPQYWDSRIASRLLEPVMESFEIRRTRLAGLFTFPHSAKHLGLYQKFGFWPRFLTSIMAKTPVPAPSTAAYRLYSALGQNEKEAALKECSALTNEIYEGLDVSCEVRSVASQGLGDILLTAEGELQGFAVCHAGRGTEAGHEACYVKFAAVRPGPEASRGMEKLLAAANDYAVKRGANKLTAGCSTGCEQAFRLMEKNGFRREMQGILMHRHNREGFDRKDAYVLYDWR